MENDETVQLQEFRFESESELLKLTVLCRKTLEQTINFRLTVQCETEDLFESLRGFGGGLPDSEPSTPTGTTTESTDAKPDLLGLDVWPASLELCNYLAAFPSLVVDSSVLELGAGIGLPALVAARLGARTAILTDYEQRVVDHVVENATLCGVSDRCSGLRLDWTKLDELPQQHHNTYSVLLAADVLYIQDIMPGFVQCVRTLLAPGGVVLVGHQTRRSLVLDETGTPEVLQKDVSFQFFLALCDQAGFHVRVLGSRASPDFPGPLLMLGIAADESVLANLPVVFRGTNDAAEVPAQTYVS